MEVRRHLGARLGSDAAVALLDQLAPHAPHPRPGEEGGSADRHDHRQQHVARRRQRGVGGQEEAHGGQDQRRADGDARQRDLPGDDGLERGAEARQRPPAASLIGPASPEDGEADGGQDDRPAVLAAEPEAGEPEDDRQPDRDEADAQHLPRPDARATAVALAVTSADSASSGARSQVSR